MNRGQWVSWAFTTLRFVLERPNAKRCPERSAWILGEFISQSPSTRIALVLLVEIRMILGGGWEARLTLNIQVMLGNHGRSCVMKLIFSL